jgi:hypothetical protein
MTAEELDARLAAQGFHYLTSAERLQLLNDAYLLDICEDTDWPFLEASKSGSAPLEIADLKTVEYVVNATRNCKLEPLIRARITDDWNPDLTEPGTPELYYVTEGKKINVFPVSSEEITVRYWRVAEELSGTKEPLLPKRWHSLIVEGARARGYRNSDDWELSQACQANFDAELERMRESLMNQERDSPDDYVVVEDPAALH